MMRALACSMLLLSACLSAPTGQAWPPDGADLRAIAAGDLGRDGTEELAAVDLAAGRVYLLRSDDLSATGATTYSDQQSINGLTAPVVVRIWDDRVVVLDSPAGAPPRLTFLDTTLTVTATMNAPGPTGPGPIGLWPSTFGMSQSSLFVTVPGQVGFVERTPNGLSSVLMVNPPQQMPWGTPLLAGGYIAPPGTLLAADATNAWRGTPATMPGMFDWQSLRSSGATWLGQTAANVNANPAPEILGFDPTAGLQQSQICAIDVAGNRVPTCLMTPFMMEANVQLFVGSVTAETATDLILLHPRPDAGSSVFVVPQLGLSDGDPGTVTGGPGGMPFDSPIQGASLAILQVVPGGAKEILLVGPDGAMACVRPGPAGPTACQ